MLARVKLKGIDGGSHKRWSMWFNSTTRRTLPGLDMYRLGGGNVANTRKGGICTGAAWLSSARVVRCWVKSRNERNPCPKLRPGKAEHSLGTAVVKTEEGGDDVKSSWPLCPVYTRATMAGTTGSQGASRRQSLKAGLSSDWRLQLASMKLESLVIADQLRRGEYVPEPCTHRPSSHESREHLKSLA